MDLPRTRNLLILLLTGFFLGGGMGLIFGDPPLCRAGEGLTAGLETVQTSEPSPPSLQLRETTSVFLAVLKALGALGLVLFLLWVLVQVLKKTGLTHSPRSSGALVQVLESRMIAPKKYVSVLEVAGEFLVVGVTDQQISLLTRLDHDSPALQPKASARSNSGPRTSRSFASLLRKAGRRDQSAPPREE